MSTLAVRQVRSAAFIAVFGALWGVLELTLGSWLHAVNLPLTGNIMLVIAIVVMIAARAFVPARGSTTLVGVIAAIVKAFSLGGVVLQPMVAIVMEAVLADLVLSVLSGDGMAQATITGMLAATWNIVHPFVMMALLYGMNLHEIAPVATKAYAMLLRHFGFVAPGLFAVLLADVLLAWVTCDRGHPRPPGRRAHAACVALPQRSMYDDLIQAVPAHLRVEECAVGTNWTVVRSAHAGVALTPVRKEQQSTLAGRVEGMPLRELAEQVKSWNEVDAALGLAAINAAVNDPGKFDDLPAGYATANIFSTLRQAAAGKRVAVIGHFPDLELWQATCDLSILERDPLPRDLSDPAAEYILPEQDMVLITA